MALRRDGAELAPLVSCSGFERAGLPCGTGPFGVLGYGACQRGGGGGGAAWRGLWAPALVRDSVARLPEELPNPALLRMMWPRRAAESSALIVVRRVQGRQDHPHKASSVGWWNGAVGAARLWAAGPTAQPQHRAYLRGHAAWVTGHVTPAVPERGLAGERSDVVAPHIPKGTVHRVRCPAIQLDDDTPRAVANVAVPPAPHRVAVHPDSERRRAARGRAPRRAGTCAPAAKSLRPRHPTARRAAGRAIDVAAAAAG